MSEGETALDARAGEPPSPTVLRRIVLVVGWLAAVALVLLVLHLLGVDVEQAPVEADPSVGDDRVDPTERRDTGGDESLAGLLEAHVTGGERDAVGAGTSEV